MEELEFLCVAAAHAENAYEASENVIERGGCRVSFQADDSEIWVAFAGTDGPLDIVHDLLMAAPVAPWMMGLEMPGKISSGVWLQLKGFRPILDDVLRTVEELMSAHPWAALHIVGHSLGGALAQELALHFDPLDGNPLHQRGNHVATVTAFSSPRWCEEKIAREVVERVGCLRVVVPIHKDGKPDLVSRLPLHRWGWRHVPEASEDARMIRMIQIMHNPQTDRVEIFVGTDPWLVTRREHPTKWRAIFSRLWSAPKVHSMAETRKMLESALNSERGETIGGNRCRK